MTLQGASYQASPSLAKLSLADGQIFRARVLGGRREWKEGESRDRELSGWVGVRVELESRDAHPWLSAGNEREAGALPDSRLQPQDFSEPLRS